MQANTIGAISSSNQSQFFNVATANYTILEASKMKEPNKLFGDFWREEEVSILFADTGIGKSILSVQIADSITKGEPTINLEVSASSQKVLYFDFENSDQQFRKRYTKPDGEPYMFSDNLLRVTQNANFDFTESSHVELFLQNIEKAVVDTGAKIIIIDNITYINGDVEKAKEASRFIKEIRSFGKKHSLSILIVSHTPKLYVTKPITINDLSGSKMISNLVDSVFVIGASKQGGSVRYLKQLKSRGGELIYNDENVIVCLVSKEDGKLQFVFNDFGNEYEHLQEIDHQERLEKVFALRSQGYSNEKIGRMLGVSEGTIRNWMKRAQESQ